MPKVKVNDITINYEQQGSGEPLVLIPYLAADNACYAFQVADYAKHFTCISLDPRGAGETDKPDGRLFDGTLRRRRRRLHGGDRRRAGACERPVARRGDRALARRQSIRSGSRSLSLHSCWPKTDPFLKAVVEGWQTIAKGLGSVTGDDHPGHLPLVLHARALRRQAGLHRPARRLRAQPADSSRSTPSSASRTR